ncbi:MAG: hypothetical protein ACRCTI_04105 [Beijerinckiaceae bacterium]
MNATPQHLVFLNQLALTAIERRNERTDEHLEWCFVVEAVLREHKRCARRLAQAERAGFGR